VEVGVAQAIGRDPVERRRRDDAAEGRGRGEPDVVGEDEQDVGRAFWRRHAHRPKGLRLRSVELDLTAELLRRRRQHMAVDRRRRIRRAGRAGDLLCAGRAGRSGNDDGRCEQQAKGRPCDHHRAPPIPEDTLSPSQPSSGLVALQRRNPPCRVNMASRRAGSDPPDRGTLSVGASAVIDLARQKLTNWEKKGSRQYPRQYQCRRA
jgi:hypothetical protein